MNSESMLKQIIDAARLRVESCASLLRVPREHFEAWVEGRSPIPSYVIPELAAILGVSERELVTGTATKRQGSESLAPAVWFKLRDDKLTDAEREFVGLVRQLGFFMGQLAIVRKARPAVKWRVVASEVLSGIDRSSPPASQGQEAAIRFRQVLDLDHGQTGIGELIRPRLRQHGLVVIESPIPASALEGCAFSIGRGEAPLPCVFANTFRSTWFRRNEVILHEVCHALFDLDNDPVALDFKEDEPTGQIAESRARAFALNCLLPEGVLTHYTNQLGINWNSLGARELAVLMAKSHSEKRTVLRSAQELGLVDAAQAQHYESLDCSEALRANSSHALTAFEFLASRTESSDPLWSAKNRTTTIGPRPLRLPVAYVEQVIESLNAGEISLGKAAELLMVDETTFLDRFEDLVNVAELA
jgi:Zn-dependent peptidase ImmA (M78 family)